MRGNNVLGLIFPNIYDELIPELTARRTMGSVPFGGKYRLIDFQLSNMVNSGINNVGVITTNNFASLMDHVGSGKAWDLSKRRGGLTILPPFSQGNSKFNTPIENIYGVRGFINNSSEEYVLLSECNCVYNMDYHKMLTFHISSGADITMMYRNGKIPAQAETPMILSLGTDSRIEEMLIRPKTLEDDGTCNYAVGCVLMKRDLLLELVTDCISRNKLDYKRHMLQDNVRNYKFYGYEFCDYSAIICSMDDYFKANMSLMQPEIRAQLFNGSRPIYTKVRDDMPSKYGLGSSVENSLIAQGCVIEGEVSNCVISKGVYIGKGAKVSNCVIMQDTKIGKNASLNYVICDKDVVVKDGRALMGYSSYPIYIAKASVV